LRNAAAQVEMMANAAAFGCHLNCSLVTVFRPPF